MVTISEIEAFCMRLGETFRPHRIILFGSYADGSARPGSDVDLLVEVSHGEYGCKAAAKIIRALKPRFGVDLVVRPEHEIDRRLVQHDSFLQSVFNQGRILYEAADR
ncbi:MAG: hypothetical protein A2269_01285 [Lentisphaerae bacterium RIFOXYA12_FULL_60_10]|nr:MAG: hypothetical protein A2269_01285 [Lentisphaerae bacterium RIFOXYA12_FULL_60_10]